MKDRNDSDAREWQLQERARSDERAGIDPAAAGAELAKYRLIARVLRQPTEGLPQSFIAETIARAEALPDANGDRIEQWLQRALFGVLFVAALVALVLVRGELTRELMTDVASAAPAASWILVVLACLVVSITTHHLPTLRPKRR